jgi:hypothetical protein
MCCSNQCPKCKHEWNHQDKPLNKKDQIIMMIFSAVVITIALTAVIRPLWLWLILEVIFNPFM